MDSLYSSADRGTTFAEEAVARLSERLSDILPKKLATRFSEAYKQQQQHVKALQQKVKAPFAAVSTSSNAQPLKVYIRVRPLQPSDAVGNPSLATTVQPASSTELSVQPPANGFRKGAAAFTYTFSTVFQPDATQAAYFDATTAPLVRQLLDFRHRSSVLMAYGSSGTGKTYSMEGPPEQPGILPRALHAVFEGLRQQRSAAAATTVSVSYCEFYNDVVYDLLEPENSGRLAGLKIRRPLRVREDGGGQVVVPGLTEVVVRSAEEALELQRAASRQRQQATTRINSLSSRSHAVFTIRLAQPASAELSLPVERGGGAAATAGGLERTSQLSFVDLAGSERADRTQNAGDRFKESVSINTSLMTLGRCLEALKHNQQACAAASAAAAAAGGGGGAGSTATAAAGPAVKVVPYRESKLTHLFRDVLLGWGNFVLCVNVSPSASDFEETHHVLKYAALATSISLAPQPAALVAAAAPAAVEPGTVLRGHNNNKGAAAAARAAAACPPTQFRQHALVAAAAGGLHGRRAGAAVTSAAAATAAAAEEALAVAESKLQHVRHENLEMRLRMEEMEEELGNLMTQLAAAERQLAEAEAEIREEVVAETQDVIRKLKEEYEEQLSDLEREAEEKAAAAAVQLAALQQQLLDDQKAASSRELELEKQLQQRDARICDLEARLTAAAESGASASSSAGGAPDTNAQQQQQKQHTAAAVQPAGATAGGGGAGEAEAAAAQPPQEAAVTAAAAAAKQRKGKRVTLAVVPSAAGISFDGAGSAGEVFLNELPAAKRRGRPRKTSVLPLPEASAAEDGPVTQEAAAMKQQVPQPAEAAASAVAAAEALAAAADAGGLHSIVEEEAPAAMVEGDAAVDPEAVMAAGAGSSFAAAAEDAVMEEATVAAGQHDETGAVLSDAAAVLPSVAASARGNEDPAAAPAQKRGRGRPRKTTIVAPPAALLQAAAVGPDHPQQAEPAAPFPGVGFSSAPGAELFVAAAARGVAAAAEASLGAAVASQPSATSPVAGASKAARRGRRMTRAAAADLGASEEIAATARALVDVARQSGSIEAAIRSRRITTVGFVGLEAIRELQYDSGEAAAQAEEEAMSAPREDLPGRGRSASVGPSCSDATTADTDATAAAPPAGKKGRGRHRKTTAVAHVLPVLDEEEDAAGEVLDAVVEAAAAAVVRLPLHQDGQPAEVEAAATAAAGAADAEDVVQQQQQQQQRQQRKELDARKQKSKTGRLRKTTALPQPVAEQQTEEDYARSPAAAAANCEGSGETTAAQAAPAAAEVVPPLAAVEEVVPEVLSQLLTQQSTEVASLAAWIGAGGALPSQQLESQAAAAAAQPVAKRGRGRPKKGTAAAAAAAEPGPQPSAADVTEAVLQPEQPRDKTAAASATQQAQTSDALQEQRQVRPAAGRKRAAGGVLAPISENIALSAPVLKQLAQTAQAAAATASPSKQPAAKRSRRASAAVITAACRDAENVASY